MEIAGIIPENTISQGEAAVVSYADALIADGLDAIRTELNYYGWNKS